MQAETHPAAGVTNSRALDAGDFAPPWREPTTVTSYCTKYGRGQKLLLGRSKPGWFLPSLTTPRLLKPCMHSATAAVQHCPGNVLAKHSTCRIPGWQVPGR